MGKQTVKSECHRDKGGVPIWPDRTDKGDRDTIDTDRGDRGFG